MSLIIESGARVNYTTIQTYDAGTGNVVGWTCERVGSGLTPLGYKISKIFCDFSKELP